MKNVKTNFRNYLLYVGVFFLAFSLNSCSDDDDNGVIEPERPTGSITVEDQVISDNTVVVDNVTISSTDEDIWLVARHIDETGDVLAQEEITGQTSTDIVLQLDDMGAGVDLQDGDTVILMLYEDNGDGNFDPATDRVVNNSTGSPASEVIIITSPGFSITDQQVIDNAVTYDNVTTTDGGFLVVYGENEDGTINEDEILGSVYVPAGESEDVTLTFDEGRAPVAGDSFTTRLHRDDPADQTFGYQDDINTDVPERFGFAEDSSVTRRTTVPAE